MRENKLQQRDLLCLRHQVLPTLTSHDLCPWFHPCCFVLLVPTPKVYRVPRASLGVTAPKLFSPTSVAGYTVPSFFLTDHSRVPGTTIRGSKWGPASAWPHKGGAPRGQGISSLVVDMDLLPTRRLRLPKAISLSSPVPARWPALGRGGGGVFTQCRGREGFRA